LLLWLSGGASLLSGLVFALIFVFLPGLFSLLTTLPEVSDRIGNYTPWLLPVLGFGSIAYMLDGYFLGLTEGKILRQSAIIAALVGFAPVALAAWIVGSIQLLWLALSLFMVVRAVTLGIRVPQTLDSQGLP
jgi:MATE family multidrug resistance protein